MCLLNNGASKYTKQKLIELKERVEKFIIIVVSIDFNILFLVIDRKICRKPGKDIEEPNNTINQPDLIDIYQKFNQKNP